MTSAPAVAVVIPAYNAAATLADTLASASAQTWRDLEIVVVDDGSRDDTAVVAERAQRADPRIRVVRQANAGLPGARNAGFRASAAPFVAPLDADDLMHPERIARQMARMEAIGPACGFVYTLSREIDDQDRIGSRRGTPGVEGKAFLRAILVNFVGNGSALLVRRAAFDDVGGYDVRLTGLGAEDWHFQRMVARRWLVGAVDEHLTGYRRMPGTMSSDEVRLKRSQLRALELLCEAAPEIPKDVAAAAEAATRALLALSHLRLGQTGAAWREAARAMRRSPAAALDVARFKGVGLLRRLQGGRPGPGPSFKVADPSTPYGAPPPAQLPRAVRAAAAREDAAWRGPPLTSSAPRQIGNVTSRQAT